MLKNFYLEYGNAELVTLVGIVTALCCGFAVGFAYWFKQYRVSRNMLVLLALLPICAFVIVLAVNRFGTIGMGLALGGAFAFMNFRSVTANARDMLFVFLSMTIGVTIGVGMFWLAVILTIIVGTLYMMWKLALPAIVHVYQKLGGRVMVEHNLRIVVPDDLDYNTALDSIFSEHLVKFTRTRVRTKNMGSLYELKYRIELKDPKNDKAFLDALRVVNRNLPIILSEISIKENNVL